MGEVLTAADAAQLQPSRRIQVLLGSMRVALHVTVAALLVLGLARCWQASHGAGDWGRLTLAGVLAAVFAGVYVAGTFVEKRRSEGGWTGSGGMRDQIVVRWQLPWLIIVTGLWLGLVITYVDFAWLVFPLFFLHLHVVGRRSVPAALACVVGLTAVVLVAYAVHRDGLDVGAVIGPVIGALVAVVMSAAYALFYDEAQRQQRIIAELEATRADLAAAERHAGALRERQRWAREVHDTVAQGLASVVLLSRAALEQRPDEQIAGQLEQMERTAAHSLGQARALVGQDAADRADATPVGELAQDLESLCAATQSTARQSGAVLVVSFHGVVPDQHADLDAASATVVRRVAQSALSNVLLHAQATRCVVTFTLHQDGCTLDIHDDGRGRGGRPPGFGIETMRQRAAERGGTLDVEDARPGGSGTVVALSLPKGRGREEDES
ncbi:histidine kinase [Micrococcus terreus]|uniref:sensor histidine kinase n=1 Tax=Micrococcus terreus TaxID=574650 RepID=UPI0033D8C2F2